MTQTAPSAAAAMPTAAAVLATRFGPIELDHDRLIAFPLGLAGFEGSTRYLLSELPGRAVQFKLLQAADDHELGFLVLPLGLENGPIMTADLEDAGRSHGIAPEDLAALAIVTLRQEPDGLACTINLRAPLLIDTGRQLGWQHVLANEDYPLRQPVGFGDADGG